MSSSTLLKGILLVICILVLLAGPDFTQRHSNPWGYDIKRDGVYWAGQLVVGADPKTFEWIKIDGKRLPWGRDAKRGFYRDRLVTNSDGPTFTAFAEDWSLAKDAHQVYHGERYIEDRPWFTGLRDKVKTNFRTKAKFVRTVAGADGATFTHWQYNFFKDANHMYEQERVIEGADPETFHELGVQGGWWADKDHVFNGTKILKHADPKTLRVDEATGDLMDDNYVYMRGHRLEAIVDGKPVPVQSKNWRKLPGTPFNCSDHFVFYAPQSEHIPGANPATFQPIERGYGKDGSRVWHEDFLLPNADPATFQPMQHPYAKDRTHVWRHRKVVPEAHPESFEILSHGFTRDANSVWFHSSKLSNVDAKTFEILEDGTARDKRGELGTNRDPRK